MSDAIHEVTETLTVELDFGLQQSCVDLAEHRGINWARLNKSVDTVSPDSGTLIVEYQPFVISEEAVYDHIETSGLLIRRETPSQPGILRRFINRLAADNRQSFGSGQLDCCDLNKSNRPGR